MMRIQMTCAAALLCLLGAGAAMTVQPEVPPPGQVRPILLPLELPAVGNVEAVRQWHFARVQQVDMTGQQDDVLLHLRTADGQVRRVAAPRAPLGELARRCNWLSSPTQTVVGRSDYVERMVAFDADDSDRLIAIVSLEPMERSKSRLAASLTR